MSKKMMRRSLALGALMAFVITGQAWAADKFTVTNSDGSNVVHDGVWNLTADTTIRSIKAYDKDSSVNIVGKDYKLTITDDTLHGIWNYEDTGIINVKELVIDSGSNGIMTYGGSYDIDAEKISITSNSGSAIVVPSDSSGNPGREIDITFKTYMDVTTYNETNGIQVGEKNAKIKIHGTKGFESNLTINASENAVYARKDGAQIIIDNVNDVSITSTNKGEQGDYKGYAIISGGSGSGVNSLVKIEATGDVDISSAKTAIYANKGNINVVGDTIDIIAGEGAGVRAGTSASDDVRGNGDIVLGNANTQSITIEGKMDYGVIARAKNNTGASDVQSSVVVNGKSLVIGAKETSDIYAGICAASGTEADTEYNSSTVTVNTDYTEINADNGIYNMSNGNVTINGDLTINAGQSAIVTRGYADTVINSENNTEITVQINGDIEFNKYYNNNTSVTDSNVVLNLANADSYFNGNIIVTNGSNVIEANKATFAEITGMKLNLSNGAQWELSEASVVNQASFGKDTVLILKDGSVFEKQAEAVNDVYALNAGGGDANKLTVEQGAKLQIGDIKETTYNIATGFANYNDVKGWTEIADNALMQATMVENAGSLQAQITAKEASQMAADTGISESTAGLVESIIKGASKADKTDAEQAAVDFINNVMKENGSDNAAVGNAINAATKMGEAGGNSATAASIVKNVTGVTNDRLSFNCGHSAPHKGGHGVGLFEEGSGADIWVEYVHGKDEVEDMPSTAGKTSYEGQYNGIVMGVDFKKVNKFQSGIAFNYGEGDTNSVGNAVRTHSDYDFWGVGYYGSIHNDDSNVIFDINYAQTDSDVTQYNSGSVIEASPETTTWSAGVKLEKLYQNENVQIVPYTGLRYMSIDADDYSTKKGEFYYSMDRQDIWLLPLGVSIKQEVTNDNGWTVSPRVDLSYIWAFGDTNSNMEVKSPFAGVSQLGYDVMDDGSFLGLVGIEAHKGQWGYGIAYSYQKGDHSESKKWFVDVNYSF